MNMSGQSLLVILLVGLVAGWLAGKIVTGWGLGLVGNIAIGIVGALVGSWLLPRVGIRIGSGVVSQIVVATIGAILVLLAIGLLRGVTGKRW
ncbi:MAG: GlsB/YeaQ/YmgE family stress response membrane protein [Xanthobacteraceae bacterium]|nr:GlsB/YeaQ/YmgE family stress response membrane protein [Xanthobacteraceae bacterium]